MCIARPMFLLPAQGGSLVVAVAMPVVRPKGGQAVDQGRSRKAVRDAGAIVVRDRFHY
jgi:hypothetical protein